MAIHKAVAYPLTDTERFDGLDRILHDLLDRKDYQELGTVANLAHRYQQLMHITYRVDDIVANGPRRHRNRVTD